MPMGKLVGVGVFGSHTWGIWADQRQEWADGRSTKIDKISGEMLDNLSSAPSLMQLPRLGCVSWGNMRTPLSAPTWLPLALKGFILLGSLALIWLIIYEFRKPSSDLVIRTESQVVVQEIQELGRLELVQFQLRDVVTKQIVNEYWFDTKVLLVIAGQAIGCIDLAKVQPGDIDVSGDSLVLTLPAPELCVVKVDHQNTTIYNTEFTLLDYIADRHGPILQTTFREAEGQIRKAALEQGILEETKKNAAKFFTAFLGNLGHRNVRIVFES